MITFCQPYQQRQPNLHLPLVMLLHELAIEFYARFRGFQWSVSLAIALATTPTAFHAGSATMN